MNNEDISDLYEKLNNISGNNKFSPDMINNIINMINNSNNNEKSNYKSDNNSSSQNLNNNSINTNGIDLETIMRMKTIIDKMNAKDDPRSNLLQSLKPYLNENRKSKIDQYIQLMNMSKVLDVFPFISGDNKK